MSAAVKDGAVRESLRQASADVPTFTREDWQLFRSLPTLCQKAGVPQERLLRLVLKELADNALDAGASVQLGCLEGGGFFVEDDGPGIPGEPDDLAHLFSLGRPLVSSKLLRLPTRGALGNGLRVVAGAVLATRGRLVVCTHGRRIQLVPQDDGSTHAQVQGPHVSPGTRIEVDVRVPGNPDTDPLEWARGAQQLSGVGKSYVGRSSPHWYESEAFFELCQAARERSVRDLVGALDGCSGGKAGPVAGDFRGRAASSLRRDEAELVLRRARSAAKQVRAARLGGVGEFEELGAHARCEGTFTLASAQGGLAAVVPFVVEAWAAAAAERSVTIHVNRTPVTAAVDCWQPIDGKTKTDVAGCNLSHEFPTGTKPLALHLNLTSPYVPINSDGKAPDLAPMVDEILEVLEKAARRAQRLRVAPAAVSQADATIESIPDAAAHASGDAEYRFSVRQLYYSVRPLVHAATGLELQYGNFEKILTKYEQDAGALAGLYRDCRGVLYHPHLRQDIPLGTLAVESYRRPAWTFSKILYAEKEGLFPILKQAGWPERHDCALLTSKGYASRAARDLLDLLGSDPEPVTLFCIHDADGPGTMIFETLQEGTSARPGRQVEIINLGLEPAEALAMGLEVEEFKRERAVPVASYVESPWRRWLQEHRVELNAMATPAFLDWLDAKIAPHESGKLVPPHELLEATFREAVEEHVLESLTERAVREAAVEKRVAKVLDDAEPELAVHAAALTRAVTTSLAKDAAAHWSTPVASLAARAATRALAGAQP